MEKLGLPAHVIPEQASVELAYDKARLELATQIIKNRDYFNVAPVDRSGSLGFGRRGELVAERVKYSIAHKLPPLMRAHVGPYAEDRAQAVALFLDWTKRLAKGGFLDVLSIGSSQLTQSHFGEDWSGLPNGGGVPINSPEEYRRVWEAARPMLVRTYAGSKHVPEMADMHTDPGYRWHALCCVVFKARCSEATIRLYRISKSILKRCAASAPEQTDEPNVPHHFAFRGCIDLAILSLGTSLQSRKIEGIILHSPDNSTR